MCQTCVLFAEADNNLRCSFHISVHVFPPQLPDNHTHPLQGRGEGVLTHNPNLTGLRIKTHLLHTPSMQDTFYFMFSLKEYFNMGRNMVFAVLLKSWKSLLSSKKPSSRNKKNS